MKQDIRKGTSHRSSKQNQQKAKGKYRQKEKKKQNHTAKPTSTTHSQLRSQESGQ
jgi:hypothetical protein